MAEIRDFNRNQFLLKDRRNKRSSSEGDKSARSLDSTIARHRQMKLYTALAVLALVGVILLCAYLNWKNMVYTDYEVVQQHEWARAGESKCVNLGGALFAYSNDGMSCTDSRGNVIWNQTYEMQNPMVRTHQKTAAVGDYNGRSIYVGNTQGMLGTVETTMPIRDFCVSPNGIVAAVLDDSKVTGIYLYDSAGEGKPLAYFKTTMSKSGYPMAIDISDDGTQVAVSYLKAEGGKIYSSVGFYNFSAVGKNYTDNLVGAYGYSDAVVPLLRFMNDNTIFAVADNQLMFYRGRQKPENLSNIVISEEIQSVFFDDSHVGLVFYNSTGETAYKMEVYDTNAKKVSDIEFDMAYTDIIFDAAGIIIYNDSACMVYNWDNKLKYEGDFKERISCFIPTGRISKYTLVTEDAIQAIELH